MRTLGVGKAVVAGPVGVDESELGDLRFQWRGAHDVVDGVELTHEAADGPALVSIEVLADLALRLVALPT